ncbi:MAG: hypothetical protein FWG05_01000, partial [Kiritimatiellaeota bacterium]|nr:hypothetical protein [Kiritimatiellota bacterium]
MSLSLFEEQRENVCGVSVGLGVSQIEENIAGIQIALVGGDAGECDGVQISCLGGGAYTLNGLQIGGLGNFNREFNGVIIA